MKSSAISAVIFLALAACLPLAAAAEHFRPSLWTQRVALPASLDEPARHETKFPTGYFLLPKITKDLTLTPEQGLIILAATTEVPAGVTLTIKPGTQIYVNEFGVLQVYGRLEAAGAKEKPIVFTTNELHADNQVWNGLIFNENSSGNLSYVSIANAYPSISVLGARVRIGHSRLFDTSTGIYNRSGQVSVTNSHINATRDGIISDTELGLSGTNISAGLSPIKILK